MINDFSVNVNSPLIYFDLSINNAWELVNFAHMPFKSSFLCGLLDLLFSCFEKPFLKEYNQSQWNEVRQIQISMYLDDHTRLFDS